MTDVTANLYQAGGLSKLKSGFLDSLAPGEALSKSARECFLLISTLRILFFLSATFVLNRVVELGTSLNLLGVAAAIGVVVGGRLALSRIRSLGVVSLMAAIYLLFRIGIFLMMLIPAESPERLFLPYNILLHGDLILLWFAAATLSTWFFWRWAHTITLELLFFSMATVYMLSGHRGFHFDTPKIINALAWNIGFGNLETLVLIGALSVTSVLIYTYVATLPSSPRHLREKGAYVSHTAAPRFFGGLVLVGITALLISAVSNQVFHHFNTLALTRTANGVGQNSDAGLSPLGFHSALGSTNQPAALIRLEGDYSENPFSPMLYLREGALSEITETEVVQANEGLDRDTAFGSPHTPFTTEEDAELSERVPLVQSIYTLTDHQRAFAVDYPVNIKRLKNPSPNRFKEVFQAYSIAPGFSLEELESMNTGDPRWSPEESAHYLKRHKDKRYEETAKTIIGDETNPYRMASALVNYLNKNAIYTLTPNHEVEGGEDPVAPFLFGDKRGYCVHFAHATVYMLRALGIPARIGTGYLTDLSQSRDGHILLRMSDRHAWAEAYFEGRGWIPFDTQPEQVESHADTQVDMSLLEELMGILGPDEEILPEDILKDEPNVEEPSEFPLPTRSHVLWTALSLLVLYVLLKLYLRYSWLLPSGLGLHMKRSYRAVSSYLCDLGYPRGFGETREDYRRRIAKELGVQTLSSNSALLQLHYGQQAESSFESSTIDRLRKKDFEALKSLKTTNRLRAFISPSSISRIFSGSGW